MARAGMRDPRWVDAILDWRWTWLVARILLTGAYLLGGVVKLFDFPGAIAEQARFGLQPAAVWAGLSILVEIGGPLLVISGRLVWLGAGGLGVLTMVAAVAADPFWTRTGPARMMALNGFLERLGLIAGFVLAALLAEHAQRETAARIAATPLPEPPRP